MVEYIIIQNMNNNKWDIRSGFVCDGFGEF